MNLIFFGDGGSLEINCCFHLRITLGLRGQYKLDKACLSFLSVLVHLMAPETLLQTVIMLSFLFLEVFS